MLSSCDVLRGVWMSEDKVSHLSLSLWNVTVFNTKLHLKKNSLIKVKTVVRLSDGVWVVRLSIRGLCVSACACMI